MTLPPGIEREGKRCYHEAAVGRADIRAREPRIRRAFHEQAEWCEQRGSPFTARLLTTLEPLLDRQTHTGRTVLDWDGPPEVHGDAVPMRLASGLQALVRAGRLPALEGLYPPRPLPSSGKLGIALAAALHGEDAALRGWLDRPPQTNEVARSAVLYPGLMTAADRTGLPIALHEVGASAGLNLMLDHYAYTLGGRRMGASEASLHLQPTWEGPAPAGPSPRIATRRGCDASPIDVTRAEHRERLHAYVWPDQDCRRTALAAAIDFARTAPPAIDRADAPAWVERAIDPAPAAGIVRVLMHSLTLGYLPDAARQRIRTHMEFVGERATADAPLAWLAFELAGGTEPRLTLRLWPGDEESVLAEADAYGRDVTWLDA